MKEILIKDLGFNGLIIVDNIEMKAIEEIMPIPAAAVQSFKAGADIIMVSHEKKNQKAVFDAFMDAVKKGDISIERLNESLRRIINVKRIMSSNKRKGPSNNLKYISRLVAENSVAALRLNDVPFLNINSKDEVLYTGYNSTLFNAIKDTFRHTEILNTTLLNYKKIKPEIPVVEFIKKFDALIIDADYPEAPQIISICNDLDLNYFVIKSHPSNIKRTLEELKPKQIVIAFESNRTYFRVALEIICGLRKAKGRSPYNIKLPNNYAYID